MISVTNHEAHLNKVAAAEKGGVAEWHKNSNGPVNIYWTVLS